MYVMAKVDKGFFSVSFNTRTSEQSNESNWRRIRNFVLMLQGNLMHAYSEVCSSTWKYSQAACAVSYSRSSQGNEILFPLPCSTPATPMGLHMGLLPSLGAGIRMQHALLLSILSPIWAPIPSTQKCPIPTLCHLVHIYPCKLAQGQDPAWLS